MYTWSNMVGSKPIRCPSYGFVNSAITSSIVCQLAESSDDPSKLLTSPVDHMTMHLSTSITVHQLAACQPRA